MSWAQLLLSQPTNTDDGDLYDHGFGHKICG